jgi:biopolymer transport protein ExbD
MRSKSVQCLPLVAASAMVIAMLSACATHEPVDVVQLEISTLGAYFVDGTLVQREALTQALLSRKRPNEELVVHLVLSQGTKYEAVRVAVEAARGAGASLGIVGNEAFYPSTPGGEPER